MKDGALRPPYLLGALVLATGAFALNAWAHSRGHDKGYSAGSISTERRLGALGAACERALEEHADLVSLVSNQRSELETIRTLLGGVSSAENGDICSNVSDACDGAISDYCYEILNNGYDPGEADRSRWD
jgi:hypothetical protein